MKFILTFLGAFFLYTNNSNAQCAIAVCDYTGMWAGSYYGGEPPFLNMAETKAEALQYCRSYGGTNCKIFYTTECRDCWVAFIISNDGYTLNYLSAWSTISKSDAEKRVREGYQNNNGVAYYKAEVTSWYIPK